MTLQDALTEDILAILPFGGTFLSVMDVAKSVAPRREREVRGTLNKLAKTKVLDLNPAGGGWPALYGRRALTRRI